MSFTEFTCRSGGSNVNAGTLDGTGEASTTPLYTATNGGWNSTTGVFTPASGNPQSAGVAVGQYASVYVDGATVAAYIAQITGVTSTTITLSLTVKAGTAPTTNATARSIVVGGAWRGPNAGVGFPFLSGYTLNTLTNANNDMVRVNLKSDQSYSMTSAVISVQGFTYLQGYTSTIGDGGKATINGPSSGASFILVNTVGNGAIFQDMIFSTNGSTGSANLAVLSVNGLAYRCVFTGGVASGLAGGGAQAVECEAYGNGTVNNANTGGFSGLAGVLRCWSHHNLNSTSGIYATGTFHAINCISSDNGGYGIYLNNTAILRVVGCVSHNNTLGFGGVAQLAGSTLIAENTILSESVAPIDPPTTPTWYRSYQNCAFFGRPIPTATGAGGPFITAGSIALTSSPFADPTNGDFSLNQSAPGWLCAGGGIETFLTPSSGYSKTTAGYPAIGISGKPRRVVQGARGIRR